MRISDLQSKDVVNVGDGKRLGTIGDLDIDPESGLIHSIIIPVAGRFFGMVGGGQDYVIPWNQIVKIGSDVILVDLRPAHETAYYLPHDSVRRSTGGY
ncbi:YlmC/YmxH family sporulation protein [Alicyclobacillus tolerans]|uniref:Sporulation protein, YlmC/YmxH family n=2 Tax=Alicyclobacillus tolerans TaxID=90970 RepID=A0A1M6Q554_9BACL|nr:MULTISPECIES: YlmC/YmxH family sporulation protein [Alicyclobacillus]MDP9728403.1 YlmC/YmxH family sporulation protein [Alicyclobacillus tengchongensis]QRF23804.1 YlmC/YmxH family sporulation protein [Alicyclobacillus sp. TC]SHK15321.1 sporulation protein, YlmC/YmxH family [Alicyclobacillus montanus]